MSEQIPETQSQELVQPVLETPVLPQKKFSLKIIVILLIVILLIGIGGVYAGMQIGKKQTTPNEIISNQEIPTVSVSEPTIIPTPDETANWKTYTNANPYSFQVKYPPDWMEKTGVASGWPYFESPEGETISFDAVPKGGMSRNDTLANYCQTRDKAGTLLEKHDIIIDNNLSVYCVDKNKSIAEFMIPRNNTQYEITCMLGKLDTCLQILSTFRFLD